MSETRLLLIGNTFSGSALLDLGLAVSNILESFVSQNTASLVFKAAYPGAAGYSAIESSSASDFSVKPLRSRTNEAMVDFLKKRLQIFVSSTYADLKEERQAAVEAILVAGHIPAGMELFAAGDESQMEVIHQWIDESDIYMLLVGGRYGSIEPKTGKSYTHLEYEYAQSLGKPSFALVVTEEGLDGLVKLQGRSVIETQNPKGLQDLRADVLSKLVRFWTDTKDIRIAVGETLSTFARRDDLQGWVRPQDQTSLPALAGEVARLSKENSQLREQLSNLNGQSAPLGVGYANLLKILKSRSLLDLLLNNTTELVSQYGLMSEMTGLTELLELGLIRRHEDKQYRLILSDQGKAFLNWLKLQTLQEDEPVTALSGV